MRKREWMLQAALAALSGGFGPIDANEIGAVYDAICAATPETAQEGAWVEHDGDASKAPPEGAMVIAYDRAGVVYQEKADHLVWDHLGCDDDILRWRYA